MTKENPANNSTCQYDSFLVGRGKGEKGGDSTINIAKSSITNGGTMGGGGASGEKKRKASHPIASAEENQ